jgi:hypothetical protein
MNIQKILFILFLVVVSLKGDFIQICYLPKGVTQRNGFINIADVDRDNNYEFIFRSSIYGITNATFYCKLHFPNEWTIDSLISDTWGSVFTLGDFDLDGLSDIVAHGAEPNHYPIIPLIGILESSDSFSYPIQEVWRDTISFCDFNPNSAYDIDQDSIPEIFDNNGDGLPYYFFIRKSTGDNQYSTVYCTNPDTIGGDVSSTHACGDFDNDGIIEFAMSGTNCWVYRCMNSTQYEQEWRYPLPSANNFDCFEINDADQDGKFEFAVKGIDFRTGIIPLSIFEANGVNSYQVIKTFNFPFYAWDYAGGYSASADLDGDNIPELVVEACEKVYIIKTSGNDSFFLWDSLPGHDTGSSVRILDVDRNGINDIVISGGNETRIYEYSPGYVEENSNKNAMKSEISLSINPNPFINNGVIEYTIHLSTYVHLAIYDAAGRMVKLITDNQKDVGIYRQKFTVEQLTQGIYFLRLKTNNDDLVRKIILLR